jgi:hypothetical protein
LPVDNLLQFLSKVRTLLRDCRGLSDGTLKELRGGIEQLADTQVDHNILTRDAFCDVIRDVAALSASGFLG